MKCLPHSWSVLKRQRLWENPELWDSLEIPEWAAKLAPIDEKLTGDAGSEKQHLKVFLVVYWEG